MRTVIVVMGSRDIRHHHEIPCAVGGKRTQRQAAGARVKTLTSRNCYVERFSCQHHRSGVSLEPQPARYINLDIPHPHFVFLLLPPFSLHQQNSHTTLKPYITNNYPIMSYDNNNNNLNTGVGSTGERKAFDPSNAFSSGGLNK